MSVWGAAIAGTVAFATAATSAAQSASESSAAGAAAGADANDRALGELAASYGELRSSEEQGMMDVLGVYDQLSDQLLQMFADDGTATG